MRAPQQAAIDQAHLLAAYLTETPASALDLHFIRHHLEALNDFAQAARTSSPLRLWNDASASSSANDRLSN